MHETFSDEQLSQLERDFEGGALREGEWHHREHLAICVRYVTRLSFVEAALRMKLGILKYNDLYRIPQTIERGYHETVQIR